MELHSMICSILGIQRFKVRNANGYVQFTKMWRIGKTKYHQL